jgi:flagellar biosynthesis/type III secretory pathway chaperone
VESHDVEHLSQSLIAVLNEQIRCAEQMLRALGEENRALLEGDAELLNQAGADKARLVAALEGLETERRSLASAIETHVTQAAIEPSAPDASWRTLLTLVAECKAQNQRNGALVKARSEQVRIALQALRGSPDPACYDPSGLAAAAKSPRRLGSA